MMSFLTGDASDRRTMDALLTDLHARFPAHPDLDARNLSKVVLAHLGANFLAACATVSFAPIPDLALLQLGKVGGHLGSLVGQPDLLASLKV